MDFEVTVKKAKIEVLEPQPEQAALNPTPGSCGPYLPTGWPMAANNVNPLATPPGWWPAMPPPPPTYPAPTTLWPWTHSPLPWPAPCQPPAWPWGWPLAAPCQPPTWPWRLPLAAPTPTAPCQPTRDSSPLAPEQVEDPDDLDVFLSQPFG